MAAYDPSELLQHAEFVRALARSLVQDDADDVAQETWLEALRRPPRQATNLRAWLATVARRLAFRARRGDRRRRRRETEVAAARTDAAPAPDEVAARLELERRLVEAVTALDEPYRSVVVLRYYDGLGPEAIARRTGDPLETVRTRLRRALARLRARLDAAHAGDRRAWSAALLPIAFRPKSALVTGATIMSAKTISLATAAAAAALLLVFLPRAVDDEDRAPARRQNAETPLAGLPAGDLEEGGGGRDGSASFPAPLPAHRLRGLVCDAAGNPVPDASVKLARGDAAATTDASGAFAIPVDGVGYAEVVVRAKGFARKSASLDPLRAEPERIVLEPGARVRLRVLSPARDPVSDAPVTAYAREERGVSGLYWSVSREVLEKGRTDAEGSFELSSVAPGRVELLVDDPRFAPATAALSVFGAEPCEAEIVLSRGATVIGRVLAPSGAPVAGARVFVDGYEPRGTASREDGAYRLDAVPEGSVEIHATAPEFGRGAFGAGGGWGEPVAIALRAGQTATGIDVVLPSPLFVTGRVVADGSPVAGVTANVVVYVRSARPQSATTGEDGRFRVGPFPFEAGVAVSAWFEARDVVVAPESREAATPQLDLGDLRARALARISGRVVDAEGRGVEEARVWLRPGATAHSVGRDGAFLVERVAPGRVELVAEAEGRRSKPVAVELEPGAEASDVLLALAPVSEISGLVRAPSGEPRVGFQVGVAPADDPERCFAWTATGEDGRFRLGRIPEGAYLVGRVRIAESVGGGVSRGLLLRSPEPVRARAGDDDVVLESAFEGPIAVGRVVDEKTGAPIRRFTGSFIHFSWFVPDSFQGHELGDAEGRFRVELDEEGAWAFEARAAAYAPARTKANAGKAGETIDFGVVKLGPGGVVAGVVRDARGAPIPFARVHVLSPQLQVNEEAPFTDLEGGFSVAALAPGVYSVFAAAPDFTLGIARNVVVDAGKPARVELRLPDPAPLEVVVTDPNGRPVAGAEVVYSFDAVRPLDSRMFRGYEPAAWGGHATGEDGRLRKRGLPAGTIDLVVSKEGFGAVRRQVELKPEEPTLVEVRLERN